MRTNLYTSLALQCQMVGNLSREALTINLERISMSNSEAYKKQIANVVGRAHHMRSVLFEPIVDEDNNKIIADPRVRASRLKAKLSNSIYEGAGENAEMIMGAHSRALRAYCERHNRFPSDELLASAHQAMENVWALGTGKKQGLGVFEAAELSTTEGIIMRDRMVSLILPVMLMSVTSNMVTLIPGEFNKSELFRVHAVAGSTFGDLTMGDRIDHTYNGRYAVMDQVMQVGTGDGAQKTFSLDTQTRFGVAYPLKRGYVKILHDRNVVAADDGNGHVMGVFKANGVTVTVSGTVDYTTGSVNVEFKEPPAVGVDVHIGYDVDIEHAPNLIPRIDHQMQSRTLRPHESAIRGNVTLQALWGMRREYGLDVDNMAMSHMRNLLAADKDRKILRDMYFYARDVVEWPLTTPDSLTLREHYETLNASLLTLDSALLVRTGVSGLTGLVGDPQAVNVFRYLPAPQFTPAPGYQNVPQPHYVGRVFGQWDLYCDPNQAAYTCLAFARGREIGHSGYVAGDAIPALTFRHPVMGDLVTNATMWDLAYRDLQPFDGRDYLMTFRMIKE